MSTLLTKKLERHIAAHFIAACFSEILHDYEGIPSFLSVYVILNYIICNIYIQILYISLLYKQVKNQKI